MSLALCATLVVPVVSGCGTWGQMNNMGRNAVIGTGAGAAIGAGIGALIGDGKGAAIGAVLGSALGAGTGAIIGNEMDKKAAELEAELAAAKVAADVETITDANGLTAIKVTLGSSLLFPTNGTSLSAASKTSLSDFAVSMRDFENTDIAVLGHTDNTGTAQINERISLQRAEAVSSYLQSKGISASRIRTEGMSFNQPVASNDTAEGRARNRRVEIYIYANADMVKAVESKSK